MVVRSKSMVNKELPAMLGYPGQIRLLDIGSALPTGIIVGLSE